MNSNSVYHASSEAPSKFLGISEIVTMTSLSRASVYRLAKEGAFPKAIALTKKRVAWDRDAIVDWMRERSASAL